MKAVIMAGGEGTRLRPLTCGIPKPMVPILNKPVMEYTINLLKKYDITDIAVTMAYFPSVIVDYFGDGSEWGVNLRYYTEDTPLGTGGSVKNAEDFLDDTFIIISGDALTDIDVERAIAYHRQKSSKATLVLKKVSIPLEYGVIITDEEGRIIRFLEKPSWGEVFSDTINTGIYVLEPEVLDYYKKGDNFDFSKDLFPKLLRDGVPMYGYVAQGYWNDIGDLRVYKEVNFDILEGRVNVQIPFNKLGEGIWAGGDIDIDKDCQITPPVLIGSGCIIGKGVHIESSILGDNCEIADNSSVKKCILWKNISLSHSVQCRGTVLCNNANIKHGANLFENTVIGSRTIIMPGATVKPDIKIWPEKTIEEDSVVNQNLVWGTRAIKTLFGFRDISGEINIDISPEFASRLGSSFGSVLKEDSKLVISSDSSSAALLIKESLISGILSTGVKIVDIENVAMPITRFAVRFYKADGGIHIRCDYGEENRIHIEFINKDGVNIDRNLERKIENIFTREDFKRCNADRIKSITRIGNFTEFYMQNGSNILKNQTHIRSTHPKLIVGSRSQHMLLLASAYLESIGCRVEVDYSFTNIDDYVAYMSETVVKRGASMGVIFSEDGERVILIDHRGRPINNERYTALVSLIILKTGAEKRLVIPYTAPRIIEDMARHYNAEVVRTKSSPADIMKEMVNTDGDKNNVYLQYILNYDAIWGTGSLIDYLTGSGTSLYELANELPEFHVQKQEVKCDWRHKGRVIREIIEENKNKDIELFEGVKINNDKGWVLVLPDSERPVCNIYAEGFTEEYARELTDIFTRRINDIIAHDDRQ